LIDEEHVTMHVVFIYSFPMQQTGRKSWQEATTFTTSDLHNAFIRCYFVVAASLSTVGISPAHGDSHVLL
jgi:hypothetical protein